MYEYLKKVYDKDQEKWVPRQKLLELAKKCGYSKEETWQSFEELKTNLDVCDSYREQEVMFKRIGLTEEEVKKTQADIDWFDSLPDIRPTK